MQFMELNSTQLCQMPTTSHVNTPWQQRLKPAPLDVLKCWETYFEKHLNTNWPKSEEALDDIPDIIPPFSIEEVHRQYQRRVSKQQFGFRKNRGTEDALFIVLQIMEKANEYLVPLHINFVDFKAVYDIIWRGALWKTLRSIWMDPKITSLIEAMYDNVESVVVINGQLTEYFRVEI